MQFPARPDAGLRKPDNRNRRRSCLTAVLLLISAVTLVSPALGEETSESEHGESEASHGKSHFHRNHFMGIVGWSHKDTDKDSVTIGMEYVRFFTRHISIGVYLEQSEGQFIADTFGIVLRGSPVKNLTLLAGPAVERSLFEEKELLTRVGLSYAFRPKNVLVSPVAWVDFVGSHKIYFVGVGVGKGF